MDFFFFFCETQPQCLTNSLIFFFFLGNQPQLLKLKTGCDLRCQLGDLENLGILSDKWWKLRDKNWVTRITNQTVANLSGRNRQKRCRLVLSKVKASNLSDTCSSPLAASSSTVCSKLTAKSPTRQLIAHFLQFQAIS